VCVETLEDVAECETTRISQHLITACGVRGQSKSGSSCLCVCVCVCGSPSCDLAFALRERESHLCLYLSILLFNSHLSFYQLFNVMSCT